MWKQFQESKDYLDPRVQLMVRMTATQLEALGAPEYAEAIRQQDEQTRPRS